MTDILLEDSTIVLAAHTTRVQGPDLELDAEDRRAPERRGGGSPRRALVHGFNDELIVNYGGDFPGGVTVQGRRSSRS
jgi:hypothetical protein